MMFPRSYDMSIKQINSRDELYVFDGYCGASKETQKKCRFITEDAWQHHFVTNMFIRPETHAELEGFEPDFTIINASSISNPRWEEHGLNSEVSGEGIEHAKIV